MIFDLIQARDSRGASSHVDAIHTRQVIDIILAAGSEYVACYLAMRYGLAMANAGHLSIQKLAKATHLSRERCTEIVADMRETITRTGGLA